MREQQQHLCLATFCGKHVFRSGLCRECWEVRCAHAIARKDEVVTWRLLDGRAVRPCGVTMRAGKTVGFYLGMPHWQIYCEDKNRWEPLPTKPTHAVHQGQNGLAHKEDLLGMFGNELQACISSGDDTSDAYDAPCNVSLSGVSTPPTPGTPRSDESIT